MKIVIVGAAGKMGRWFTRYFYLKNFRIFVYDLNKEPLDDLCNLYNATKVENLETDISDADIILISVPIEITGNLVKKLSESVKTDTLIIEISSLKKDIVPQLKKVSNKGIRILSIHPMFGSGVKKIKAHKIVIIEISNINREFNEAKKLFPEAELVCATVNEHDRNMAITLSFTHFINLIFLSVICSNDFNKLRRLSGTSFNLQLMLSESIMNDDSGFLASLQTRNAYSSEFIERLIEEAMKIKKMIDSKDNENLEAIFNKLKKRLIKDKEYNKSYDKMYNIIDSLK